MLPEFTIRLVERLLTRYCRERVHEALRHTVRLGWVIEGNEVTLFEERSGLLDESRRVRLDMARFRFIERTKKWVLFYSDSESNWHVYYLGPKSDFESLLREVDEDPIQVFWWGRG